MRTSAVAAFFFTLAVLASLAEGRHSKRRRYHHGRRHSSAFVDEIQISRQLRSALASYVKPDECQERDDDLAISRGRTCQRKCDSDSACLNDRKLCLCDGVCGMSCIRPEKECPELPDPPHGQVHLTGRWKIISEFLRIPENSCWKFWNVLMADWDKPRQAVAAFCNLWLGDFCFWWGGKQQHLKMCSSFRHFSSKLSTQLDPCNKFWFKKQIHMVLNQYTVHPYSVWTDMLVLEFGLNLKVDAKVVQQLQPS